MKTTVAQRISAQLALAVTVAIFAVGAAQTRMGRWTRTTRERGEVVSYVIVIAGLAVIAVGVVAYLGPKVMEHLNRIQ